MFPYGFFGGQKYVPEGNHHSLAMTTGEASASAHDGKPSAPHAGSVITSIASMAHCTTSPSPGVSGGGMTLYSPLTPPTASQPTAMHTTRTVSSVERQEKERLLQRALPDAQGWSILSDFKLISNISSGSNLQRDYV